MLSPGSGFKVLWGLGAFPLMYLPQGVASTYLHRLLWMLLPPALNYPHVVLN